MRNVEQRAIKRTGLTYADYLELPDDGNRYEILDGALAVSPAPTTLHQRVSLALALALGRHIQARRLGTLLYAPVDVVLADDCVVEPDLVFVSKARAEIVEMHAIVGPPDLVIEILSRSSVRRDRTTKAAIYARYGVPHYWLVDPTKRILERFERGPRRFRRAGLDEGDAIVQSAPFPALKLRLADLWH
jgi:Uma2 family endonuclease